MRPNSLKMLDVNYLRENLETAKAGLKKRNVEDTSIVDRVIMVDDQRKKAQFELDELLAKSNSFSKEIGNLFKQGKAEEANKLKAESAVVREEAKGQEAKLNQFVADLKELLLAVPNIPHESVVQGKSDADNVEVRNWGACPKLDENHKLPHWELAKKYNLFDLDLGSKLTGAGFPVFTGKGALLQRGLINFFLDKAIEVGYKEVIPPLMVNADSATATGQLPDKEGQMYEMKLDPYYLIPTAEVPITIFIEIRF